MAAVLAYCRGHSVAAGALPYPLKACGGAARSDTEFRIKYYHLLYGILQNTAFWGMGFQTPIRIHPTAAALH